MLRKLAFRFKRNTFGYIRVLRDFRELKKQVGTSSLQSFEFAKKYYVFSDFFDDAGVATGHYFHQDLYMASKIYEKYPLNHYDVGSRIDGFVAHLAVFTKVHVFDLRQLNTSAKNIEFHQLDIMDSEQIRFLPKVDSLSCLHSIEHFGLGRYGDSIDFDGWFKGLRNLSCLLKSGGMFYFSTPISYRQRIEFNAHRIFHPGFLTKLLAKDFEIVEMSVVRDTGQLEIGVDFLSSIFLKTFNDTYACGLWILRKK